MMINSLLTRAKVFFYSTITSLMSGINRLRATSESMVNDAVQNPFGGGFGASLLSAQTSNSIFKVNWKNIGQAVVTLTIWILMGFTAGFLIGMITPR